MNRAPSGEEFRVRTNTLLPIERVRALSELDPVRATVSVLANWALIGASVAVAWWQPRIWVIGLSIVGVAAGQHGLAILAHQSAHYRMYQTRWLNDAVGHLCAWPLGVSMITYRIIHRIHHNYLYTAIDPDLALMAGYPRGKWYLARKLLKDLVGLTTLKNYLYFFGKSPVSKSPGKPGAPVDDTSPALRAAAQRDQTRVILFQLATMTTCFLAGGLQQYLLLWMLPLATLLQMLLRLRAVCEHGAVPNVSDPRTAARTNLVPWWIGGILFPHHMNYHIEHHLYPSIPHYRLRDCHLALRDAGCLHGAEVVPTLRQTLGRVFG